LTLPPPVGENDNDNWLSPANHPCHDGLVTYLDLACRSQRRVKMTLRSATKSLLVLVLALPVIQAVLYWVRGLTASMGDEAGAAVISHVATVCQIIWSITLVGLVIVLALVTVNERPEE
jgi:hypothetical protein